MVLDGAGLEVVVDLVGGRGAEAGKRWLMEVSCSSMMVRTASPIFILRTGASSVTLLPDHFLPSPDHPPPHPTSNGQPEGSRRHQFFGGDAGSRGIRSISEYCPPVGDVTKRPPAVQTAPRPSKRRRPTAGEQPGCPENNYGKVGGGRRGVRNEKQPHFVL